MLTKELGFPSVPIQVRSFFLLMLQISKRNGGILLQGFRGVSECSTASILVDGKPKFPLRWTRTPIAVQGYDFNKMSPYKKAVVCFLEKFPLMDLHNLLNRETDAKSLKEISMHICIHSSPIASKLACMYSPPTVNIYYVH